AQVLRPHAQTPLLKPVHLHQQDLGVQNHAVADEALDAGMQDARGNQMENELFAAHHQGMAGVVAALITHHYLGLRGQEIDDLPLAFVPPLGAYYHYIWQNNALLFTNPYIKSQGAAKPKRKIPAGAGQRGSRIGLRGRTYQKTRPRREVRITLPWGRTYWQFPVSSSAGPF